MLNLCSFLLADVSANAKEFSFFLADAPANAKGLSSFLAAPSANANLFPFFLADSSEGLSESSFDFADVPSGLSVNDFSLACASAGLSEPPFDLADTSAGLFYFPEISATVFSKLSQLQVFDSAVNERRISGTKKSIRFIKRIIFAAGHLFSHFRCLLETEGMTFSSSIAPYSDDRHSSLSVSLSIPFLGPSLLSASWHTVP